jgi:hypothetical protein
MENVLFQRPCFLLGFGLRSLAEFSSAFSD